MFHWKQPHPFICVYGWFLRTAAERSGGNRDCLCSSKVCISICELPDTQMGFPLSSCISYKFHLYFLRHEPASVSSQRLRQPSSLMSLAIHPDDAAWSFLLRLDPSDNDSPSLTLGFTTLWWWSLELWWDNPQGHWTGNSSEMKTIFLPHTWITQLSPERNI